MSSRVLIQPLNLADFPTPTDALNPGFADLVNNELGDAVTAADGFDAILSELEAIVDALDNGLSILAGADGGTLDDTFAEILALDPAPAAQNVADFQAASSAYDTDVDALGTLLTGAGPPAPSKAGQSTASLVVTFTGGAGSPQTLCLTAEVQ